MTGNTAARRRLNERIAAAANDLLSDRSYVAPLDVLVRIGFIEP